MHNLLDANLLDPSIRGHVNQQLDEQIDAMLSSMGIGVDSLPALQAKLIGGSGIAWKPFALVASGKVSETAALASACVLLRVMERNISGSLPVGILPIDNTVPPGGAVGDPESQGHYEVLEQQTLGGEAATYDAR